ncbi:MAG: VCBS repeat-containing protein [Clostridia bacterium]|nr:VCBS repeat-containing protein [Clostridia bacterium]
MKWTKKGFEEFRKGTFGNGGQNIYVSRKGVLQRIHNFDVNGDGWFDLPLANSHSMNERPPVFVYDSIKSEPLRLPTYGAFDACLTDLNGDGCQDLILACQHDGVHTDVSAIIYYGSETGLSEKYRSELRVFGASAVVAGDFKNCGKKALAFLAGEKMRIFYQTPQGIEPSVFEDVNINGLTMAVGDLDGDGYDDLYVMHQGDGSQTVYWGGEDGINPERKTDFGASMKIDVRGSTTAGRIASGWFPWKTSILNINGKPMTVRVENADVILDSWQNGKIPHEEYRFTCFDYEKLMEIPSLRYRGIMHVVAGDLKNNGGCDIAIALSFDRDTETEIMVLWGDSGYDVSNATHIPIRYPRSLTISPICKDGKNVLFACQGGERDRNELDSSIFSFDENGNETLLAKIPSWDANVILNGITYTDGRRQTVVINHEGELSKGFEDVAFFLGGPDGFSAERTITLPGCAAVDLIPADLNDSGHPDVLVVNCSENTPWEDPGCEIFWGSKDGFDPQNKTSLPVILGHSCVIGDFRHSGYLDVVATSLRSRLMLIFEGGPNGFDLENPQKIIMGPKPELCDPFTWPGEDEDPQYCEEENGLINQFGGMRNMFCADFNGDGWLDLFVPQLYGTNSFILWGGPDGFSTENMQTLATDGAVTGNAADLNGNGYLDLVLGGFTALGKSQVKESYITIYWGGPDGYKENRKTQLPAFCINDLTIQDFNNDGILDIYACAYYGVRTRDTDSVIYFGSKDGIFYQDNKKRIFNNSGTGCLSGDFNGDGYIDLAVASHKKQGNHVCESFVYWGGPDGINTERYTPLPGRGPHGMSTVDVGNIMDRSDSEYYVSETFEIPDGMTATKVSWIAQNGKSTWVKMQLRCASSIQELDNTKWSESVENGDDITKLNLKGFLQYKLELGARCGAGTPRVTEVTVDFE